MPRDIGVVTDILAVPASHLPGQHGRLRTGAAESLPVSRSGRRRASRSSPIIYALVESRPRISRVALKAPRRRCADGCCLDAGRLIDHNREGPVASSNLSSFSHDRLGRIATRGVPDAASWSA